MLSGDISKMMKGNYEAVRSAQRYLYENFEEYAKKLQGKKVINIQGFKDVAVDTAKQYDLKSLKINNYGEFRFPGDGSQRAFGEFYNQLTKLDDNITLEQAISLRQVFNDFATNFKTEFKGKIPEDQAQAIGNLAARLEYDILNLKNVDGAIDETIFNTALAKLAAANEYFAATIPNFSGGVASNMKQVNANIFGPGPDLDRGLMYKDEIFNIILGRAKTSDEAMKHLLALAETTPDQLRAYKKAGNKSGVPVDLEVLVKDLDIDSPTYGQTIKKVLPVISQGPNAGRNKILRRIFDDAIKESIEGLPAGVTSSQFLSVNSVAPEIVQKSGLKKAAPDMVEFSDVRFDPKKFADQLGLDTEDGRRILATALEGTGVTVKGVQDFVNAVEMARGFVINDASTFLTRRLTLGGLRSLFSFGGGAVLVGGAASMNPILTALGLKYGSRLLTDPKALKAFTEIYEEMAKAPTGGGDLKKVLTVSRRNDILNWAADFLPTEDELKEQDFVNQIDQSIFSLMNKGQTKAEQINARESQLDMMSGKMTSDQTRTAKNIQERLNPRFNLDASAVTPVAPRPINNLNNQARNELAFGTVDDAITAQGGIGGL